MSREPSSEDKGPAARPEARGKRRRVVLPGEALLRGETAPLSNEDAVGRDRQAGMMVKAPPAPALVVPEPDLLLELLVVAFDPPAPFGRGNQICNGDVGRQV